MSILFKGNLEEGNYTLIKSTDGWVLKGETSYVGFNFADRKDEPQTNKDFKVTYTCSFTECDNFKNFGFGEKCIECKRKQSEAKHKDEPQTSKIIEAYAKGFEDGADAVNAMPSTECIMCKHFKDRPNCGWECEYDTFEECNYEPKDEPQTCEECEHWSDTEDSCADRHGCTMTERSSE